MLLKELYITEGSKNRDIQYSSTYKKAAGKLAKSGNTKAIKALKQIVGELVHVDTVKELAPKWNNHPLTGRPDGYYGAHIQGTSVVLAYNLISDSLVQLMCVGSHSTCYDNLKRR